MSETIHSFIWLDSGINKGKIAENEGRNKKWRVNILKTSPNPGNFRIEKKSQELKPLCNEMYYALNYIF